MTTDGDATGSIEATTEYPSIGRFHSRQIVRYASDTSGPSNRSACARISREVQPLPDVQISAPGAVRCRL